MSCNIVTKELFVEEGNSSSGGGGYQNIFAESVVVSSVFPNNSLLAISFPVFTTGECTVTHQRGV